VTPSKLSALRRWRMIRSAGCRQSAGLVSDQGGAGGDRIAAAGTPGPLLPGGPQERECHASGRSSYPRFVVIREIRVFGRGGNFVIKGHG
jgi:hypothetical protein